jgi:hypothetical protein
MDEYSIETRSQNIFNKNTKEYFLEVLSSYRQGNYRSATVMLWSVAVCDLIFKLKHMRDMYGDKIAKKILEDVKKIQTDKPRSSDWESKLVEFISARTNLLEVAEFEHLLYLQKERHLAAHPVLSKDFELYQPNKDTVRALIRNTLDGILTKPPIYTQKIFNAFVSDLESSKNILIKDEMLKSYLESKYFSRTDKKLEQSLIRSLWKLVFKLSDPECKRNRKINYRAMKLLIKRNESEIINLISSDQEHFSNVASSGMPVLYLVRLLSKYPKIYAELTDAARVVIRHTVNNHPTAKCLGSFMKDSLKEHFKDMVTWIEGDDAPDLSDDTISALRKLSDSPEWDNLSRLILNAYYGASPLYDEADKRFSLAIKPYVSEYGEDELLDLLAKIEQNNQTYTRRRAKDDYKIIKERCDVVLGENYDYSPYPHFSKSIS